MDKLSKTERSINMRAIRSKDTKPELLIRKFLFRNKFRYRLHSKKLPGKPDIILKKHNTLIFVNGCFWHMHKKCIEGKIPKSNRAYWKKKLLANVNRDNKNYKSLRKMGWKIIIIWECDIKKKKKSFKNLIPRLIKGKTI
jgi:DNA mismatch endonuclease, patch repair protein